MQSVHLYPLMAFCFIGMLLNVSAVYAQHTTLSGTVINEKNQPLSNVYVLLNGDLYYAVTDTNGRFSIQQVKPGEYTLRIQRIGFETLEKVITVDSEMDGKLILTLKPQRYRSKETVVVTATRTRRDIEDVPVPVTVIDEKEISSTGSMRLSDILAEQTGLMLTADHGMGVQLQGFDPEYTLIMLDGQPLIGRTAGTLNLERITVDNVQQIEMIKGPSSALWGSDALAGVINIITKQGDRPFELNVNSRYGRNQTLDFGANLSMQRNDWKQNLFLNRNSSQGYSLIPNSIAQTVPSYQNYTATYRTEIPVSDAIDLELHGRYYNEKQSGTDYLGSTDNPTLLDGEDLQEDYSLSPSVHFSLTGGLRGKISHYFSGFRTDTRYTYRQGDSLYEHTTFKQYYNKSELQLNQTWNASHTSTWGGGYVHEQLNAQRYPHNPAFNSYFLLAQHEWMPGTRWDLIAGLRFDAHSEYTSQLSPKLSVRYKLSDRLHLRASGGSGFKAPDFRQLFLDFTNPTAGYSVFGSSNVRERIRELQEQNKIQQILIPLNQLEEIRSERSLAFNAGVDLRPSEGLELRVNLFRNNVDDLIESAPVARKDNGQPIYSYFNLQNVYTQGLETQLRWQPVEQLLISAGYQLLDARRKIEETRTVQDDQGEVVERTFSSYEPMLNRSQHMANIKLYYTWEEPDISANLRGTWQGKYARFDANGNGFADPGEYDDGYMIWNTAVDKTFSGRYTLRLGVDNLFDFTRPFDLSWLPGRIFYAQLSLQLY